MPDIKGRGKAKIEIRYETGELIQIDLENVVTVGIKNQFFDYESPEYSGIIETVPTGFCTISVTGMKAVKRA